MVAAMAAARTYLPPPLSSTFSSTSSGFSRSIKWQTRRNVSSQMRSVSGAVTAEIKFVNGEEAKKLVTEEGYTVVDVRDKSQYDRAHIVSSTHIPLFTLNTDNDISTNIRRAAHTGFAGLFYGVAFTKPNLNFITDVEEKFPKDSKLLLVCQEGLRSGPAVRKLEQAGYQNLAYIDKGLQSVKPDLFPKEGPKELMDAGKVGLVTIQAQASRVLGAVLIAAYLFLTFFPTQAEELFFKK